MSCHHLTCYWFQCFWCFNSHAFQFPNVRASMFELKKGSFLIYWLGWILFQNSPSTANFCSFYLALCFRLMIQTQLVLVSSFKAMLTDLHILELVGKSTLIDIFLFSRFCLKEIQNTFFCQSVQWLSHNQSYCGHCIRISIEGLTIDGHLKRMKRRRINLRKERRKLGRIYRNTYALRKRELLERRVFNSFGFVYP